MNQKKLQQMSVKMGGLRVHIRINTVAVQVRDPQLTKLMGRARSSISRLRLEQKSCMRGVSSPLPHISSRRGVFSTGSVPPFTLTDGPVGRADLVVYLKPLDC